MSQNFIKFGSLLINSLKVSKIEILPNQYLMHVCKDVLYTNYFIKSLPPDIYLICLKERPNDYKILTEWINRPN
jgi:hypothetical protein